MYFIFLLKKFKRLVRERERETERERERQRCVGTHRVQKRVSDPGDGVIGGVTAGYGWVTLVL